MAALAEEYLVIQGDDTHVGGDRIGQAAVVQVVDWGSVGLANRAAFGQAFVGLHVGYGGVEIPSPTEFQPQRSIVKTSGSIGRSPTCPHQSDLSVIDEYFSLRSTFGGTLAEVASIFFDRFGVKSNDPKKKAGNFGWS